jgi:hypothetical protein
MDVENQRRMRTPTSKGAEYAAALQAKKNAASSRIQARRATARSKDEDDALASLMSKINVSDNDAEIDALTAQLSRMGGRKRKTRKSKGKKSRKTRKH